MYFYFVLDCAHLNDSSDECEFLDEEIESKTSDMQDPLIYKDAPIRVSESFIATLAYVLRHHPNGTEIEDLLQLVNLHCKEEENMMQPTYYFFKKYFADMDCPKIFHHFCKSCLTALPSQQSSCPNNKKHPGVMVSTVL